MVVVCISLITFASYITGNIKDFPLFIYLLSFPPPLPERKEKRWKNEEVQLNTDSNVNEKLLR